MNPFVAVPGGYVSLTTRDEAMFLAHLANAVAAYLRGDALLELLDWADLSAIEMRLKPPASFDDAAAVEFRRLAEPEVTANRAGAMELLAENWQAAATGPALAQVVMEAPQKPDQHGIAVIVEETVGMGASVRDATPKGGARDTSNDDDGATGPEMQKMDDVVGLAFFDADVKQALQALATLRIMLGAALGIETDADVEALYDSLESHWGKKGDKAEQLRDFWSRAFLSLGFCQESLLEVAAP
ncbi:MAG: hypothetical protein FWG25_10685 [Promicromonosporaceae bacterium]|nr:hypothetical protein [Promicromonosporaceae bacterium]